MIDILDKNGIDTIQMVNNDTNELASIGIDVLKKDYSDRISILESLAKGDDKDSLNARAILYLANKFDYEKQNKNIKTSSFLSALFGTAQMINGIEKDNSNLNFSDKVTEENKENLNYFGRKMLELKEKPQSKEEFCADLKNHAKSNITKDEIVVLCKMFDLPKPPSLLNNEHKKLIKESLKLAVAYEKTQDFDKSLKKEIQSVIDRKDNAPKKEKEKAKAKEADFQYGRNVMKNINENNKFAHKTQGTQSTSELRRQLNEIFGMGVASLEMAVISLALKKMVSLICSDLEEAL